MATWCIVGASRGIGFEFVRQVLDRGDQVIAAVRNPYQASELWQLAATRTVPGACQLCECDVTSERSINVSYHSFLTSNVD
jgi:NAD(P)-dependent dehydrogenase (short-subunit alcohol dehydrogenase family)